MVALQVCNTSCYYWTAHQRSNLKKNIIKYYLLVSRW